MNPQEQANILYRNFLCIMPKTLSEKRKHDTAKECALKHIEFIDTGLTYDMYGDLTDAGSLFWEEVMKEINKL